MARSSSLAAAALAAGSLVAGCSPGLTGGTPLAVRPVCTVETMVSDSAVIAWNGRVLTADRADPAGGRAFTPFGALTGPASNASLPTTNATGVPDCYGISEAWLRVPGAHQVHRAMLVPATRNSDAGSGGATGAEWSSAVEDNTGRWVRLSGSGPATRRQDPFDPVATMDYLPALMVVGDNDPRVFGCGPSRTQDDALATTVLFESRHPSANPDPVSFQTQDVLFGDTHFVPNAPGPLRGPANPPTPRLPAVGGPVGEGYVTCAMTQSGDDLATRTLHLLKRDGHHVWHATWSDWGPVTPESGAPVNELRAVTPWRDVAVDAGMDYGEVVDLAAVGRGNNVSVVLLARNGGTYKLWHLVRFGSGAWRAPDEVLKLNGDAPSGTVYSYRLAIGACPAPGVDANGDPRAELLIAMQGGSDGGVYTVSVVQGARQWTPSGAASIYSPMSRISDGALGLAFGNGVRRLSVRGVRVNARPFPETPVASPSP